MEKSKFLEIIEPFPGNTKRLPRSEENGRYLNMFPANGKDYFIMSEHDVFPIVRHSWAMKYSFQFMANVDFQTGYNNRVAMSKLFTKWVRQQVEFEELVLKNKSEQDEMLKLSEFRYHAGFYLATLFIKERNENFLQWTLAEAESKIEDWAKEGYGWEDFFELAAIFSPLLLEKHGELALTMMGAENLATNPN